MPSDRDASISDAAFREALREYHSAAVEMATQLVSADRWRDAEARVLALYAERPAEAGVEGAVMSRIPTNGWPEVVLRLRKDLELNPGDRVTVRRCGEGE